MVAALCAVFFLTPLFEGAQSLTWVDVRFSVVLCFLSLCDDDGSGSSIDALITFDKTSAFFYLVGFSALVHFWQAFVDFYEQLASLRRDFKVAI